MLQQIFIGNIVAALAIQQTLALALAFFIPVIGYFLFGFGFWVMFAFENKIPPHHLITYILFWPVLVWIDIYKKVSDCFY